MFMGDLVDVVFVVVVGQCFGNLGIVKFGVIDFNNILVVVQGLFYQVGDLFLLFFVCQYVVELQVGKVLVQYFVEFLNVQVMCVVILLVVDYQYFVGLWCYFFQY